MQSWQENHFWLCTMISSPWLGTLHYGIIDVIKCLKEIKIEILKVRINGILLILYPVIWNRITIKFPAGFNPNSYQIQNNRNIFSVPTPFLRLYLNFIYLSYNLNRQTFIHDKNYKFFISNYCPTPYWMNIIHAYIGPNPLEKPQKKLFYFKWSDH